MLIETEATPNPLTRKYLPGRTVMASGSRDFPSASAAEASPLAHALFMTGDVDGVFFGRDFISVSASPDAAWEALEPDILSILLDHFVTDAPLFAPGSASGIAVDPTDDGAVMAVEEDRFLAVADEDLLFPFGEPGDRDLVDPEFLERCQRGVEPSPAAVDEDEVGHRLAIVE
jgi:hypothetical protein